jgi:hypothetical protein
MTQTVIIDLGKHIRVLRRLREKLQSEVQAFFSEFKQTIGKEE